MDVTGCLGRFWWTEGAVSWLVVEASEGGAVRVRMVSYQRAGSYHLHEGFCCLLPALVTGVMT